MKLTEFYDLIINNNHDGSVVLTDDYNITEVDKAESKYFNTCELIKKIDFQGKVNFYNNATPMFYKISNTIEEINVQNFHFNNNTWLRFMFHECKSLKKITGLSSWDVSKINNFCYLFSNCNNLEQIDDISSWDVSNGHIFTCVFKRTYKLKDLPISNWNMSNATKLYSMFEKTSAKFDISNWNLQPNVIKTICSEIDYDDWVIDE